MAMTVWLPDAGHGPGLLLIQEIFGVGPYIRAVAERLAAAGYVVGAPDVFWRFAPGLGVDARRGRVWPTRCSRSANLDPERGRRRLPSPRSTTSPGLAEADGAARRHRLLPRRHARLRRRRRRRPGRVRQLLRLRRAVDDRPPRRGVVPDAVPLRRQRPATSPARASRRWPRRSPAAPTSCSTSSWPATPSTTTRRRCSGTSRPPRRRGPRRWPSWPSTCPVRAFCRLDTARSGRHQTTER